MLEVTIHSRSLTFDGGMGAVTVAWDDATDRLFERAERDGKTRWLLAAVESAWDSGDAAWFNLTLDALQARLEDL